MIMLCVVYFNFHYISFCFSLCWGIHVCVCVCVCQLH